MGKLFTLGSLSLLLLSFFVFIVKQKTNMAFLFFWKRKKLLFVYVSSSGGEQSLHIIPFSLSLANVQYVYKYILYCTYIHASGWRTISMLRHAKAFPLVGTPEEVSPPTHYIRPTPECQHTFPVSYKGKKQEILIHIFNFIFKSKMCTCTRFYSALNFSCPFDCFKQTTFKTPLSLFW